MQSSSKLSKSFLLLLALAATLAPATIARAADDDDDTRVVIDARVEGLTADGNGVVGVSTGMSEGGTGGLWMLFILLTALTAGVMFKDPKRSHLD